jgi:glutamate dehydrogenase
MTSPAEKKKASQLTEVAKLTASKVAPAHKALASVFVSRFYRDVDADEFNARDAASWAGLAASHIGFGTEFKSGAAKIRVFNPTLTDHRWTAPVTVVEFINDDMPFLVDSIAMEINRMGFGVQLVVHPLYAAERDANGQLTNLSDPAQGQRLESWIHVETDRITDPDRMQELTKNLERVMGDVRASVVDWKAMETRVQETLNGMAGAAKAVPLAELDEARDFLRWVADSHFTFLGCRDYELKSDNGADQLSMVPKSGLGILRHPEQGGPSKSFAELPADIRALAKKPNLLVLTKANSRSTVHRAGYLDYIGVKRFDDAGNVIGERRFIGLYTSSAYHADPADIPLLRRKVAAVMEKTGFPPASHAGKNLVSILDGYPRDELFQINEEELFDNAMGILHLGERSRTRVFVRRDIYGRFYSCLIYLPRENYNTEVRLKLQDMLMKTFSGTSTDFNVQLSDSVLARVHLLVRTPPANAVQLDVKALEQQIAATVRRWEEGVFAMVVANAGEEAANQARREYVLPFPAAYTEVTSAEQAVADFNAARTLSEAKPIAMSLYHEPGHHARNALRFRLYHLGKPVPLSGSLPMLENMGVRVEGEKSFTIARRNAPAIYIHDFSILPLHGAFHLKEIKDKFEAAFAMVWNKQVENDGFNRLTLAAGLSATDIIVLRAYAKYLKQTGFTFSQQYIENTLAAHPGVTSELAALFHSRFDPALDADRDEMVAMGASTIEGALERVSNADEDRILRRYLAVIMATLRTNHYQPDAQGHRKPYVSFKFECAKVPDLPEPKPLFEIFVYSPRVEGVHLRFGKVARGGLRWSDRLEDFRTEVLGLVKAQQVKNTVIVPVGSKGGFVLKAAPAASDREAFQKEGVACYQTFLRGLLDVTDNLVQGKVVPRAQIVRHDPDDPYLVVAADKGTATFSDYANAISKEYGHWLGDAFASGGSIGYDHKKMGITAKGAWEAVKRHFREMGINTQTTDFTVAGVGDMSGDVFGNGMLLSKHIRLVAAFDHRHIFLDPNPDSGKSFVERERMFALPRSSWEDYDKSLISKGGGVHSRGAKSIPLTPEIKAVLGIDATKESMTPAELMRAILMAPVDLFYNGGIGTYVKASYQSHGEVGDRANDAIRVNGNELKCKVVAEGGNLGCTQLGRVEYALHGGCICTDAIDNSAGVDCSDHEVNIKILVSAAIEQGKLKPEERDLLLASLTDEVGELVLKDNYYQTQSLAVSGVRGEKLLDAQQQFIRHLERAGRLNRKVEYLPSDDEIAERKDKKIGLTSPERAVLLAYSKMELFDHILASDVIDDPYVAQCLVGYFPKPLQQRFADVMTSHQLKREIIATEVANTTINRTGSVFIHRMRTETGATSPEVLRCFILTRDVYRVADTWLSIDKLDNIVPAATQSEMLIDVGRLVLRGTLWFLRRRGERMPIADVVKFFAPGVDAVSGGLKTLMSAEDVKALGAGEAKLTAQGVPGALAAVVAKCDAMYAVLDIVEMAHEMKRDVQLAAQVYFALAGKLGLRWVAGEVTKLPFESHWQAMARAAMRDDLANLQRALTESVLKLSPSINERDGLIGAWEKHHEKSLARMREVMDDLRGARETDLAMLSVLLRELRVLA